MFRACARSLARAQNSAIYLRLDTPHQGLLSPPATGIRFLSAFTPSFMPRYTATVLCKVIAVYSTTKNVQDCILAYCALHTGHSLKPFVP